MVLGTMPGCSTLDEAEPGATNIFQLLNPPPPATAAAWAVDPYDADKRYRGTLLLGTAVFANEPVYIQLFLDNAKDEDPAVRMASLRGLANHGTSEHAMVLAAGLADDDPGVRREAAHGLQRLHNPQAVDGLLQRLKVEDEDEARVRYEAAEALGQYRERRVVEGLIATLADRQLAVNAAALRSLRMLTGQDLGFSQRAWVEWLRQHDAPFAAASVYEYPAFSRDTFWYEYIPLFPKPPNEVGGAPAGLELPGGTVSPGPGGRARNEPTKPSNRG